MCSLKIQIKLSGKGLICFDLFSLVTGFRQSEASHIRCLDVENIFLND